MAADDSATDEGDNLIQEKPHLNLDQINVVVKRQEIPIRVLIQLVNSLDIDIINEISNEAPQS